MKRLMIVADHSFVVHSIRLALRQTAGFQVVGFFDGRSSIRQPLEQLWPDVVLVDDMQQTENAIARLREVASSAPNAKALLLTLRMDHEWLDKAFGAGVHAVVSKSVHSASLGTLLREISLDNVVLRYESPAPAETATSCPLTDRELEILMLVVEGYTNSRIAQQLWVTEQTVKFHLSNTYRKLGVANRTEAARYAHVHKLTSPARQVLSEPTRLAS
jgi:DNA-binding NarL/FixJ family response regulator